MSPDTAPQMTRWAVMLTISAHAASAAYSATRAETPISGDDLARAAH